MSVLLTKSNAFYNSGYHLKSKGFHNECLHSYYYSIFLFCKHLLIHVDGIEFEKKVNQSSHGKKKDLHKFIKDELASKIKQTNRDVLLVNQFTDEYTALKTLRIEADYYEIEHNEFSSEKADDLHNSIKRILKKVYK